MELMNVSVYSCGDTSLGCSCGDCPSSPVCSSLEPPSPPKSNACTIKIWSLKVGFKFWYPTLLLYFHISINSLDNKLKYLGIKNYCSSWNFRVWMASRPFKLFLRSVLTSSILIWISLPRWFMQISCIDFSITILYVIFISSFLGWALFHPTKENRGFSSREEPLLNIGDDGEIKSVNLAENENVTTEAGFAVIFIYF